VQRHTLRRRRTNAGDIGACALNPVIQALLAIYPSLGTWVHEHPEIPAAIIEAARQHEVPATILVAVCFTESRLGADTRTQLTCGVYRVERARQADAAAHALARWKTRCGSWRGALTMFRGGECQSRDPHGYVPRVLALSQRLGGEPVAETQTSVASAPRRPARRRRHHHR
jgi:hypothetical protein